MGKYIGIIGSGASILSLFFIQTEEKSIIRVALLLVGIFAVLLSAFLEIKLYFKTKPKKFNRKENIDYMNDILSLEGRAVVFAGDLSWIDNDTIKETIKRKKNDLYLCAKKGAKNLDEFKKAGVNIYVYDDDFSPKTHFTILRKGNMNEKIAIASVMDEYQKEKRYVYEINSDDKEFYHRWILQAANDLFELTRVINKALR